MPCPQTVISRSVQHPLRDSYVFKDSVRVTCIEGHEIVMVSNLCFWLKALHKVPVEPVGTTVVLDLFKEKTANHALAFYVAQPSFLGSHVNNIMLFPWMTVIVIERAHSSAKGLVLHSDHELRPESNDGQAEDQLQEAWLSHMTMKVLPAISRQEDRQQSPSLICQHYTFLAKSWEIEGSQQLPGCSCWWRSGQTQVTDKRGKERVHNKLWWHQSDAVRAMKSSLKCHICIRISALEA